MKIDFWYNFRHSLEVFDEPIWATEVHINLNLHFSQALFNLFSLFQQNGKLPNKDNQAEHVKKILIILAQLENNFNLPASLAISNMLQSIKIEVNILELFKEISEAKINLPEAIAEGNLFKIQYEINCLVQAALVLGMAYNLDFLELLKNSFEKTEKIKPNLIKKDTISRTTNIKKIGGQEILVDIKLSKNKQYKGIIVKYGKKIFSTGDIVKDFFKASTYIRDCKKESAENLNINYSTNFRNFIINNIGRYQMGYLIDEKIILASSLITNKTSDKTVVMEKGLPIILTNELEEYDTFLDYIIK